MSPRWSGRPGPGLPACATVLAGLLAWALSGCAPVETGAVPADENKARVVEFWRHYHEASAARARGDVAAAAASYESALRLDPDHEDSLDHHGKCHQ
jgi:hypothetical protein